MIKLFLYSQDDGTFTSEATGPEGDIVRDIPLSFDFTLTPPPNYDQVWRWIDTQWVELLPINNPNIPYNDVSVWDESLNEWVADEELLAIKHTKDQAVMWERIKEKRLLETTSGVYVLSIDKRLYTDNTSTIMYSQIGASISLGIFEPLMWKTMEGDFIQMTAELFKEFQVLMMLNTQRIYGKAEWHKVMMESTDSPLDYDFSGGWN
jgi:hypothetical protein